MNWRITKAIVLGSAASAALTTTGLAIFHMANVSATGPDTPVAFLTWFVLAFATTTIVAASVGLAWRHFAMRQGWNGAHAYWLPGALVGVIVPIILIFTRTPAAPSADNWRLMLVGATLGGFTGLFAWLIYRPDRDAPNPTTSAP